MNTFTLTPPNETTVFCDISILNKAYNMILDFNCVYAIENTLEALKTNDELDGDDRFDTEFLNSLDDDVKYYLIKKLENFERVKTKVHDQINDAFKWNEEYQEHEDNLRNIFHCYDELPEFNERNNLKVYLQEKTQAVLIEDLEKELVNMFDYHAELINEYESGLKDDYFLALTHNIGETEIPIELKLKDNEIDLKALKVILNASEYSTPCNSIERIKNIHDSFFFYSYTGKTACFYYSVNQVNEAIERLLTKE